MDDLIDRQSAIQALDNAAEHWNIAEPYHEGIRAGFRNSARLLLSFPSVQPTIDAVPVVRCKDCRHYRQIGRATGICAIHDIEHRLFADWFCADGKRKEE